MKIKKFAEIKNMAVFKDFKWDDDINEFKDVNIIYGANYSGKTTLSRILRGFETKIISDKYKDFSFAIETDGGVLNENNYKEDQNGLFIRVFNEDFIRDNLSFFYDENGTVNSFAILGKENKKILEEIKKMNEELGDADVEKPTGLYKTKIDAGSKQKEEEQNYNKYKTNLEGVMTNKAKDIKDRGNRFNAGEYTKTHLRKDFEALSSYKKLSDAEIEDREKIINEVYIAANPQQIAIPELSLEEIEKRCKELCERELGERKKLDELTDNSDIENWVHKGMDYNGAGEKCKFCGNEISPTRWEDLKQHFNEEVELLYKDIDNILLSIKNEKDKINNITLSDKVNFYSLFYNQYDDLKIKKDEFDKTYNGKLDSLKKLIIERKNHINKTVSFTYHSDSVLDIDFLGIYNKLVSMSIEHGEKLKDNQSQAYKDLRMAEVYKWVKDSEYENNCKTLEELKIKKDIADSNLKEVQERIEELKKSIAEKSKLIQSEEKGAGEVNKLLNKFFGDKHLQLQVKDESNGSEFAIVRNGGKQQAYNLSEGERNLIAFCYFVAKLQDKDIDTEEKSPIIWIDDPISSLDSDNIYFVYSLVQYMVSNGIIDFEQLFVTTHSLLFLKYLSNIHVNKPRKREYFWIECINGISAIRIMPDYLKNYGTEFQQLFNEIYRCAHITKNDDDSNDLVVNFGNKARKFLEIYFCFKYPNCDKFHEKCKRFFKNDFLIAQQVQKICNEESHFDNIFENPDMVINNNVVRKIARKILSRLWYVDREQYKIFVRKDKGSQGVKNGK